LIECVSPACEGNWIPRSCFIHLHFCTFSGASSFSFFHLKIQGEADRGVDGSTSRWHFHSIAERLKAKENDGPGASHRIVTNKLENDNKKRRQTGNFQLETNYSKAIADQSKLESSFTRIIRSSSSWLLISVNAGCLITHLLVLLHSI
jgi:hypothetical protein